MSLSRVLLTVTLVVLPCCAAVQSLPVVASKSGTVRTESIPLNQLNPARQYSVLYSLSSLRMSPTARLSVEIAQGPVILASKILHSGDPDFYTQFRIAQTGPVEVRVKNSGVI